MSTQATEAALAGNIGLRSVHAYLRANGWYREESIGGDTADIYVWAEDEREAAIVPAFEHYGDYGTRIYQIAEQLARLEGRRMLAVLVDLALAESDLIRVRLPNADDDNAVSISDGAAALAEAKRLLLAAACSADRPQRMYRAGRNKRATDYLRKVRLGQTEPGSFVINILSPVPPSLQKKLFREEPVKDLYEEPFERRVARKLVSGLRASRTATDRVNRDAAGIGEFEERVNDGVSANLCRSVARLTEVGGGLEVSVSWAMTRPFSTAAPERLVVSFRPPDAPVLDEAARVLADRQERTDEEIQGYVSGLARGKGESHGIATIRAFVDGRMTSVKVVFDPSDYREITRAHRDRLSVSLEGDLRREGQRWRLRNPRQVTILREKGGA
ncbi:MAG: hypothetical protein OXU69_07430 [Gemmatimonadota bacterium]|nr:hypothetical protein [Gemmatimonadota bacterium]MDE2984523.1 hypothetical protein [Gemmatimonadota bacterium]